MSDTKWFFMWTGDGMLQLKQFPMPHMDFVFEGPFDTELEAANAALKKAIEMRDLYQDAIPTARGAIDRINKYLRAQGKRHSADDIVKAFKKHKHNLLATESGDCCDSGSILRAFDGVPPQRPKKLIVMNDGVLMRQMMLELGYTEEEIDNAR